VNAPHTDGLPGSFRLEYGFASDRGLRRALNEDSLVADRRLFAVADGMGGHEAGEVASAICVRTLAEGQDHSIGGLTPDELQGLMGAADHAIRQAAGSRAGTTLSGAALVYEAGAPYWLVFNVGDSRTYRVSQGKLQRISVDHSEVQELVDHGQITEEQALVHPRRHVITRALGTGDDSEADFWMLPVQPGDRLLICSDGLTGEVRDEEIASILGANPMPQDAVDRLVEAALRGGGRDNITVIVVDVVQAHEDDELSDTAPRSNFEDNQTKPRMEGEAQ
jgi:PPM family protein phosphatase